MDSGSNTACVERKAALVGMGIYRWGCRCCGPKDHEEHARINRRVRRAARQKTKMEIEYEKEE